MFFEETYSNYYVNPEGIFQGINEEKCRIGQTSYLQELQEGLKGKLLTFKDKSCAVCQEIFLEAWLETGGQDFEKFCEVTAERNTVHSWWMQASYTVTLL